MSNLRSYQPLTEVDGAVWEALGRSIFDLARDLEGVFLVGKVLKTSAPDESFLS